MMFPGRKGIRFTMMIIGGCLLSFTANAQQQNTLTQHEKQEGWVLLFNGKNLDGWHSYHQKSPAKDWKVGSNAIMLIKNNSDDISDCADLVTNKEYVNFDLKLEWKMKPGVDSGIMIYVNESPDYGQTYETGPEIQIADLADTKPDSRILKERAADIFDLIAVDTEQVWRAGHWNQYEIISNKGHLEVFQNGHKEIDTYLWNDHWRELIAHSKFKSMPNFGTFHKGHISLQGTEVKGQSKEKIWFRNIKIRKLPS